jgi:hypothetical protein
MLPLGDGRRTVLQVRARIDPFHAAWRDLDRGITFTARVPLSSQRDSAAHVLRNLELTSGNGDTTQVGRLYLHTWDDNYVSGHTVWSGNRYEAQFARIE